MTILILDSPNFDPSEVIAQQIELLELQYKHIGELIILAREIQSKGVTTMNFEVFDKSEVEHYKAEVKEKWGKTQAYQDYTQKSATQSEDEQKEIANQLLPKNRYSAVSLK